MIINLITRTMTAKEKFENAIVRYNAELREIRNEKFWVGNDGRIVHVFIVNDNMYYDHYSLSIKGMRNDIRVVREVIDAVCTDSDYCLPEDERSLLREYMNNEEMDVDEQTEALFVIWNNFDLSCLEGSQLYFVESYRDDDETDYVSELRLTKIQSLLVDNMVRAWKDCEAAGVGFFVGECNDLKAYNSSKYSLEYDPDNSCTIIEDMADAAFNAMRVLDIAPSDSYGNEWELIVNK